MTDYHKIAQDLIENLGRKENISLVTCTETCLNFVLKDMSLPNLERLQNIETIEEIKISRGKCQIVIKDANQIHQAMSDLDSLKESPEKTNPVSVVLDFISACMVPLFPAIIAGGLLKVVLVVFGPTLLNVMSTTSDTYIVMKALADAPFYFLPIMLAYTASKKLECNSFLSVMIASMLIYPDLINLLGQDTPTYLFGVIPVIHGNYSSSIFPAMLSTLLLKYVENAVDRITPDLAKNFLKPLMIVIIVAPITLCALAPLGLIIGEGLQYVLNGLYNFAPWLAYALLSAFMPFIVMTGMHWALFPAALMAMTSPGYDVLLLPTMLVSNIAQAGAVFGYAFKTKNKEEKSLAIPAGISALLAGVTEPAIYGITLPKKKPMVAACVTSGIVGLFAGIVGLKGYAFAIPCLTSIAQFIGPDPKNFMYACIVSLASFVISFALSFVLSKD